MGAHIMFLMRRNRWQYMKVREHARALVHARLGYFNAVYGFSVGKVFIKNHKSRWGSCSEKGNLNFNYKIFFLPPALKDYIIIHELCHLGEFNHSSAFWTLVARAAPRWRECRRALRRLSSR